MANEMTRQNLQTTQVRQKRDYEMHLSESHPERDVAYMESSTKVGSKPVWSGPWLVIKIQPPPLYAVLGQWKTPMLHHCHLKSFDQIWLL